MYPYFDVVAGLMWSEDPESYAGSSIAICRGKLRKEDTQNEKLVSGMLN
jgi:hypothetical protein